MLKLCRPEHFVPSSGAALTHLFASLQAAAKRFKVTAGGKVMMRHPGKQHINEKMSSKRLSKLGKEHAVSDWGVMIKPGQARDMLCLHNTPCLCAPLTVDQVPSKNVLPPAHVLPLVLCQPCCNPGTCWVMPTLLYTPAYAVASSWDRSLP